MATNPTVTARVLYEPIFDAQIEAGATALIQQQLIRRGWPIDDPLSLVSQRMKRDAWEDAEAVLRAAAKVTK